MSQVYNGVRDQMAIGKLDYLIAVQHLGPEASGANVRKQIQDKHNKKVPVGASYIVLKRLEDENLLKSTLEPDPNRTGRSRRRYWLTPEAVTRLEQLHRELHPEANFHPPRNDPKVFAP